MVFVCDICKFSTSRKGNLTQHFTSNKHKELTKHIENHKDEIKHMQLKKQNDFICKNCGKEYRSGQALCNHKAKSCNHSEKAKNYKLQKEVERLKRGKDKLKTMMINNGNLTNNNTNNDSSINNSLVDNSTKIIINLNGYGETDISHLTDKNYIEIMTNIANFLKLVHTNPDKPENMNLLLTNLQDTHMKVYENNKWNRVQKNTQLETIIVKLYDVIEKWMITNESKLSKLEINQWKKFYENIIENDDSRETAKDNIATELYNSRKIIGINKNKIEDEKETKSKTLQTIRNI
jgi:hypothetical protein